MNTKIKYEGKMFLTAFFRHLLCPGLVDIAYFFIVHFFFIPVKFNLQQLLAQHCDGRTEARLYVLYVLVDPAILLLSLRDRCIYKTKEMRTHIQVFGKMIFHRGRSGSETRDLVIFQFVLSLSPANRFGEVSHAYHGDELDVTE